MNLLAIELVEGWKPTPTFTDKTMLMLMNQYIQSSFLAPLFGALYFWYEKCRLPITPYYYLLQSECSTQDDESIQNAIVTNYLTVAGKCLICLLNFRGWVTFACNCSYLVTNGLMITCQCLKAYVQLFER